MCNMYMRVIIICACIFYGLACLLLIYLELSDIVLQ